MHIDCPYTPYTLPTIDFVGGETQNLIFNVYYNSESSSPEKQPFNMSDHTVNFAIVNYINKTGKPIFSKAMNIVPIKEIAAAINHLVWHPISDEDTELCNRLTVTLHANETANLAGKYIYQISMKDKKGVNIDIPNQGILRIANNINKDFIQ